MNKYRIVILSRSRSKWISAHKIFPEATLVVPDNEVDFYKHLGLEIIPINPEIRGLGEIRNWIIKKFPEEVIVMVDDDVTALWYMHVAYGVNIKDPDYIQQVIENLIVMSLDLGVKCFGFNQAFDVRKYRPFEPFRLKGWVGGVIGVIGKDQLFTTVNKCKVDIDFCLEQLKTNRIILVDNRYSFIQKRDRNLGGLSLIRTQNQIEAEKRFLKQKWQNHVQFKKTKTTERIMVNVER
ncbi:MAG: hypothetical protein KKH52_04490 [Nanoarchaeota archaeon]|nr:hypothetical protein [Nanoarchaeota archaeon]